MVQLEFGISMVCINKIRFCSVYFPHAADSKKKLPSPHLWWTNMHLCNLCLTHGIVINWLMVIQKAIVSHKKKILIPFAPVSLSTWRKILHLETTSMILLLSCKILYVFKSMDGWFHSYNALLFVSVIGHK